MLNPLTVKTELRSEGFNYNAALVALCSFALSPFLLCKDKVLLCVQL